MPLLNRLSFGEWVWAILTTAAVVAVLLAAGKYAANAETMPEQMLTDHDNYRAELHAEFVEWLILLNEPDLPQIVPVARHAHPAPPVVSVAVEIAGIEWMRPTVEAVFGTHTDEALAIIFCESRGVITAANPTSSARGAWQFLRGWYSGEWSTVVGAFDPFSLEESTAAAWIVSDGGTNWQDWAASRGCHGLH